MLSRRRFLQTSGTVASVSLLPRMSLAQEQASKNKFFLTILINGGADATYLFDARPLAMSNAENGVLQNYTGEEPYVWDKDGDFTTFASPATEILKQHKDRLTIVNGVQMATSFDGHDQNTNFFLTGNPFGGASFIPHLAQSAEVRRPLEYMQTDSVFADINNSSASIEISPGSASQLSAATQSLEGFSLDHPSIRFAKASMARSQANRGMFANGAKKMDASLDHVPELTTQLSGLEIETGNDDLTNKLNMVSNFFKKGLTNHALIEIRGNSNNVDTHDSQSAQSQPELYRSIAQDIHTVIEYLLNTSLDDESSLFDHTAFAITSEFGRTMRQLGLPLDGTGTDHNSLTNFFIFGGGNINGGQVIGASDFRSSNDPLDGAHLSLDPSRVKIMGQKFDFEKNQAVFEPAETYQVDRYLTCNSVVNTIYDHFGVDKSLYRLTERNGVIAPSIKGLFG